MNKLKLNTMKNTIENTMDLQSVLTLYTSSFTEGFMKVLDNYNTQSTSITEVDNEIILSEKPTLISKSINKGFEKLKNNTLKEKLQNCKTIEFNPKNHIRVSDLKYKSIYDLDSLSKKKWFDYFSKGNVYINKDVTSSKISQRILFDKSILQFFGSTDGLIN
jgi:hypothetical protein